MQRTVAGPCQVRKKDMARQTVLPILLLLVLTCSFTCRPERLGTSLTGKLVIDATCSHFVVQLLQGSTDSTKVVDNWKNTANDSIYTHVFTVANVCNFGATGLVRGDIFTFEIDPEMPMEDCAVCLIYYPTPEVVHSIKHIQKVK
ncbi:hypothetical protein ACX0G9_16095 [Flavitalea flava]